MNTQPRVFVGLDGSSASFSALRRGVQEAMRQDAVLHVVHARPANRVPGIDPDLHGPDLSQAELDNYFADKLADWVNEGLGHVPDGLVITPRIPVGTPAACLVHLADRVEDILVVGGSSRSPIRRLFAPSVGERCVRHARCSVFVVPAPAQEPLSLSRPPWRRAYARSDLWAQFEGETAQPPRGG